MSRGDSYPGEGSDEERTEEAGRADGGASGDEKPEEPKEIEEPDIPEWEDEYLDRVANDLKFNYDLRKDERVVGERFPLYGRLRMENRKKFIHESINYANHAIEEHLFVRRADAVGTAMLERYVELAHDLADDRIDPDEEHQSTDFTFVVVAPNVSEDVRSFVSGFRDRTLIKFGYYGHYEVNLVVVAPEAEEHVASRNADVWRAFVHWADPDEGRSDGLLSRLSGLFGR
ncbi:hypothetical protein HUG10_12845 [Halorarum halophilum]|uniref:DUF8052 domain-containing protein n=1 Tax=Halorarum halophilum TaxID=2743090 RepID=A0A7D5KV43_9EURY|nr:hypothetical protein [Halobaculum halophilum]QLG28380.1 hypothetical protein HUG10_12845 [Halobaculum halophilum]